MLLSEPLGRPTINSIAKVNKVPTKRAKPVQRLYRAVGLPSLFHPLKRASSTPLYI